jgi:hypothetical protein
MARARGDAASDGVRRREIHRGNRRVPGRQAVAFLSTIGAVVGVLAIACGSHEYSAKIRSAHTSRRRCLSSRAELVRWYLASFAALGVERRGSAFSTPADQ